MDSAHLTKLLQHVRSGTVSVQEALQQLRTLPYENVGFASIDHHRSVRQGFPEVIFCEGKTKAQVTTIARALIKKGNAVLATRAQPDVGRALSKSIPKAVYHQKARVVSIQKQKPTPRGHIVIVTAGTSDIPVAEEARVTAEIMGSRVENTF